MTGPGSVPSTGLDLDALREKAEAAGRGFPPDDDEYVRACDPVTILAVLALVDDLRAENERMREALSMGLPLSPLPHTCEGGCKPCFDEWKRWEAVRDQFPDLAGSPADTKEATDG